MSRQWRIRTVQLVGLLAVAYLVLHVLQWDPEPLRLSLLVTLVCVAGWLVHDLLASTTAAPELGTEADTAPHEGAIDPRTDTLTRMIEAHQQSRHHDRDLHDRLTAVVDHRLTQRHGLRLDHHRDEVRELLGEDVLGVLADPSRRLSLTDIDTTLQRIEAL